MAKYTKIIELYGLPGCGKSTLANHAKKALINDNFKVAIWSDITKEFKKISFFRKIICIPYSLLFEYLLLFINFKKNKERKLYIYGFSLKISTLYKYSKKYSKFDYIIVDHGIIQNIISLQGNEMFRDNYRIKNSIKRVINNENIDYIIFCNIDSDKAILRMKERKRKREGRIDQIKDEKLLIEAYQNESKKSVFCTSIIKDNCNNFKYSELDMNFDVVLILQNFYKIIS